MTHLHVPDGVLPWWVVGISLLLAGIAVAGVLRSRRETEKVLFLARVGVMAAALTVSLSLPLGAAHLSLAPLAGMMLGPGGGFLAAFLANASVAAVGHGGITALGVNGLFLGLQAVAGSILFRLLRGSLGVRGAAAAAAAVTLVLASAGGILALRALPLSAEEAHHNGHGGEWGLWAVGAFAAAVTVAETLATASIVEFLARVRSDLVHGSAVPRPPGTPA